MKKTFLKLLVGASSVMLLSAPVFASPAVNVTHKQAESPSPRFTYTYEKTVKKQYSKHSDITTELFYEEYHEAYGICRGNLNLKSSRVLPNGTWEATYTGTMRSNNI